MSFKSVSLLGALVASVVLANYLTSWFGQVPVGFGLMATAGTVMPWPATGLSVQTFEED